MTHPWDGELELFYFLCLSYNGRDVCSFIYLGHKWVQTLASEQLSERLKHQACLESFVPPTLFRIISVASGKSLYYGLLGTENLHLFRLGYLYPKEVGKSPSSAAPSPCCHYVWQSLMTSRQGHREDNCSLSMLWLEYIMFPMTSLFGWSSTQHPLHSKPCPVSESPWNGSCSPRDAWDHAYSYLRPGPQTCHVASPCGTSSSPGTTQECFRLNLDLLIQPDLIYCIGGET